MAYCTNCGQQLTDGSKFCSNCGNEVNNSSTTQRKTVYDGEIHKCPNCGELLNSFVINCPACGYELRSVKTNSPVNQLASKLAKTLSVEEKIELITNFYIPNTKEDIYDFFILAVSNLEDSNYDTDDAWKAKLEQTYHKAKISFGNTPEFEYIDKIYNRTNAKVHKRSLFAFVRKNKTTCINIGLIGAGVLFLLLGVLLFATSNDNVGIGLGGIMIAMVGLVFLISPMWIMEELKKKEKSNNNKNAQKTNFSSTVAIGKDADDFIHEYYENVVEYLKDLGFHNIVVKPERKGLLDTDGSIKEISISGNTEFSDNDEFNIDSKIIIRYYSKKC